MMETKIVQSEAEYRNVEKAAKKKVRRGRRPKKDMPTEPGNNILNVSSESIVITNSTLKGDFILKNANNHILLPSTSANSHMPPVNLIKEEKLKNSQERVRFFTNYMAFKNRKRAVWSPPTDKTTKLEDIEIIDNVLIKQDFVFKFKPLKKPLSGFFIRKRVTKCKCINPNLPVLTISNFTMKTMNNTIEILNKTFKLLNINKSEESSQVNLSTEPQIDKTENSSESSIKEPKLEEKQVKKEPKVRKGRRQPKIKDKTQNNSESSNVAIKEPKTEENQVEKEPKVRKERKNRVRRSRQNKREKFHNYPDYMIDNELIEGLKNGTLIKGFIRINIRNNKDAYVTNIIKGDTDYYINSVLDQNRALDGDEVILQVKPENEWDEGRKTARVVCVSKMVHNRTSIGKLSPIPKNKDFAHFLPRDHRFPTLRIPIINCPPNFLENPRKFAKNLFVAKLTEWNSTDCGNGLILDNVGQVDDLKAENLAILKTYGLDHEPFDMELLKILPKIDNNKFPEEWMEGREDLREECIFTIDPLTARDLDDAVSCKFLNDGNVEIGVHIADVSQFLQEDTQLDKLIRLRATSVYMVDRVHHMLPLELCMNCSLLPAMEKLAFSVFWKMTPEAQIIETRFSKTIIKSCVQLAYEHAQQIIENPTNFQNFPQIKNGFKLEHVAKSILKLYEISQILRRKRFENGALRINQIKISFQLDAENGQPIAYRSERLLEANNLIEEFMLLANISVAEKLKEDFENIAFLRRHDAPKASMLKELKMTLESVGIHVDVATAKSLQGTLSKYASKDVLGQVLSHLFAKPMTRAVYFCPGSEENVNYEHFALNIPLYTHFTSPIRRYADIMVHRLLAASLGVAEKPDWDPDFVSDVAAQCNVNKYNAKKAQEDSTKLYLGIYLTKNGPLIRDGAVVDVRERSFDVLVLDCGEVVRIYLNNIQGCSRELEEIPCVDLDAKQKEYQKKNWRIKLTFLQPDKTPAVEIIMIELFSLVKVELTRCPKQRKIIGNLITPIM